MIPILLYVLTTGLQFLIKYFDAAGNKKQDGTASPSASEVNRFRFVTLILLPDYGTPH